MIKVIYSIANNSNIFEKLSLILLFLLPLALNVSILISELFSALIGIFALVWLIKNQQNYQILKNIKIPLYTILLFYLIILISLAFSQNFNKSFLPSFFYFRYLLLSLAIFILIYKFQQTLKIILASLLLLLFLIVIDGIFEIMKINNIFGLRLEEYRYKFGQHFYLTGFFGEEKKLGSFLIRLCPLILSLIIFLDFKIFKKFDIKIPIVIIIGSLIFLSSERVALFLFILLLIFLFFIFKRKLLLFFYSFLTLALIAIAQPQLIQKYVYDTLAQFEFLNTYQMYEEEDGSKRRKKIIENLDFSNFKYFSEEHEKLIKSGIIIFKENIFTGIGLKNYHRYCKNIKEERSLDIKCSSHPHNTYIQIFLDIGIFGGFLIIFVFLYIMRLNLKILFIKNPSAEVKSLYVLNLAIIINLMPFIPSGSFFNNWINLMLYFPLGTWFYLFHYIKKNKKL
tara:strand:+ start:5643 stop:7001 length:1359 start_codon:yes stop_codon:yes gene_type:complete